MQQLDNITNEPRQKFTILLEEDSSSIVLNLTYKPTQLGWFIDVEYEPLGFAVYGLRLTSNLNLLNQWRNILPFGLRCVGADAQDPLSLQDFLVGRAELSVLSKEEVDMVVEWEKDRA